MYQSKVSFSPGVSSAEVSREEEEGKAGDVPERAACAATRWDFDSGMSQSGRDEGTSLYS